MMAMSAASEILAGGIDEDLKDFVQRSVVSLSDFLAKAAIPIGFKLSAGMQDVECLEIWGELSRLLANVLAGAKVLGSKVLHNLGRPQVATGSSICASGSPIQRRAGA
jgi:hypothetical protein